MPLEPITEEDAARLRGFYRLCFRDKKFKDAINFPKTGDCNNINNCKIIHVKNTSNFLKLTATFKNLRAKKILIDIRYVKNTSQKEMIINIAARYLYTFLKYKKKEQSNRVYILDDDMRKIHDALEKQKYVDLARDLINEPANVATPQYIAKYIQTLFQQTGTMVKIFDHKTIKEHGLNLVDAVGKASANKPRFVVIEHKPTGGKLKTICLCGKGVTFDAGGLQIKTGNANSYTMKGDKTGACIVISILKYLVDINYPAHVVGVVPLVENIISADVTHPGDIIRSYSGKTIEIRDTDAEGRLILADALSYCQHYKPDYIFDLATLTGWANRLHCDTSAVFFSSNNKLHTAIDEIGEAIGERTWGMPKWLEYMKFCDSTVADLKNFDFEIHGCGSGSGYMAAMFMAHFVPESCLSNWVHFDITNNVDTGYLNANTMLLVIELIKKLTSNKR